MTTTNSVVAFEPTTQLVFQKTETDGGNLETSSVQDSIRITNLSPDQDVLFRVQTTAPLTYRVKPSHGRIAIGESSVVQIVMVAETSKADKFLVKYAPIDPTIPADGNFIELFKTVESEAQEHRLKCVVLQPDGSPITYAAPSPLQQDGALSGEFATEKEPQPANPPAAPTTAATTVPAAAAIAAASGAPAASSPASAVPSPAKPAASHSGAQQPPSQTASQPAATAAGWDPKDLKLQSLTMRNQELMRQVDDLQKAVAKTAPSTASQVPPEWVALLNSQTGFPPVLVILIALFSFLVGLLF